METIYLGGIGTQHLKTSRNSTLIKVTPITAAATDAATSLPLILLTLFASRYNFGIGATNE